MNSDIIKSRIADSLSPSHHGYTNHINALDNSFDVRGSPALSTSRAGGSEPPADHVLEVQIVPQDNWGEGGTTGGGNTSDVSASFVDDCGTNGSRRRRRQLPLFDGLGGPGEQEEEEGGVGGGRRWLSLAAVCAVLIVAFVSPPLMLLAPMLYRLLHSVQPEVSAPEEPGWCEDAACEGRLAALAFKQLLLLLGGWALVAGMRRVQLPRVHVLRVLLVASVGLVTLVYWLLVAVRVAEPGRRRWVQSAATLADGMSEVLLWQLVVALLLLQLPPAPCHQLLVRVVRSPDGACRHYTIGAASVQSAAAHVLHRYLADCPPYNPFLQRPPGSGRRLSRQSSVNSYKYYDVDTGNGDCNGSQMGPRVLPGDKRRDGCSHNERFYDELEHERRVKKRRARLLTAAEEAFTHIRRVRLEPHSLPAQGSESALTAAEAAQAIFPSVARPLQKYLRATRQQPRHSAPAITAHLAQCLAHDAAPSAFLQPYLQPAPIGGAGGGQVWSLVCNSRQLWRQLVPGCVFQLRRGDVSLLCTVQQLPPLRLLEQVIDPRCDRFQLKLNSETSV